MPTKKPITYTPKDYYTSYTQNSQGIRPVTFGANHPNKADEHYDTFTVSYLLGSSAKIDKTAEKFPNHVTSVMYLAPHTKVSRKDVLVNMCAAHSPGCAMACLSHTSGRMIGHSPQLAQIKRTIIFLDDRQFFMTQLHKEIAVNKLEAELEGLIYSVRLNGSADIRWENVKHAGDNLMAHFPDLQFYDYTKIASRLGKQSDNYHLVLSANELTTDEQIITTLQSNHNAVIVFNVKRNGGLPESYLGYKVIDGDLHDARFLDDETGVIVGLRRKGYKSLETPFFRDVE